MYLSDVFLPYLITGDLFYIKYCLFPQFLVTMEATRFRSVTNLHTKQVMILISKSTYFYKKQQNLDYQLFLLVLVPISVDSFNHLTIKMLRRNIEHFLKSAYMKD